MRRQGANPSRRSTHSAKNLATRLIMMPIIALLFATALHTQTSRVDCDGRQMRGTSISVHSDSDDETSVLTYARSAGDLCESATIIGRLTYTEDEDDVASIPFGGSALLRE